MGKLTLLYMGLKSIIAKPFAKYISKKVTNESTNALQWQQYWFEQLLANGTKTLFGKDHHFDSISNYEDFKKRVPVRDYEGFREYVEKALSRRRKCFMARKTFILEQDLRNYIRCKVYSNHQRFHPISYQIGPQCPVMLYC